MCLFRLITGISVDGMATFTARRMPGSERFLALWLAAFPPQGMTESTNTLSTGAVVSTWLRDLVRGGLIMEACHAKPRLTPLTLLQCCLSRCLGR